MGLPMEKGIKRNHRQSKEEEKKKFQAMIRRSSMGSFESMLSPDGNTLIGSQDVSMEYLDDSSSALFPQMMDVPAANTNQTVPPEASGRTKQRRSRKSKLSAEEKKAKRKLNDEKYRQKKKAKIERLEKECKKLEGLKNEVEKLRLYCADKDDVSRRLEEQIKIGEKLTAEIDQLKDEMKRRENSKGQHLAEDLQRPIFHISNPSWPLDYQNLEDYQGAGSNHEGYNDLSDGYEGTLLLCYFDTFLAEFMAKLDEDVKSNVKFSDFVGLEGERKRVGAYNFPSSLVPTIENITKAFGDVTTGCLLNHELVENAYILFCATVNEMNELPLEEVTESRILKWRDTIKDAVRINCKVCFAMEHLKKIARAYFGLKAFQELWSVDRKISKLENEMYVLCQESHKIEQQLNTLKEEKAKKEDLKSEQCEACIASAQEFRGKTVGSVLFQFQELDCV